MAKERGKDVVVVNGLKDIMAELSTMGERLRRKHLRQAANVGGRLIINAAKANLRARGTRGKRINKKGKRLKGLAMSMRIRPSGSWPSKEKLARAGVIGAAIGFEWPVGAHAHLVEFGHRMVSSKKSGSKELGVVPPRPFFRPAVQSVKGQIFSIMRQKLADGMKKEALASFNKLKALRG